MAIISLDHGSGGNLTAELLNNIFFKYLDNDLLRQKDDSTILPSLQENIVVSTDSFIIKPLFFPGGDIGKLAVCGTVNDLAMNGAQPLYLTVGFIIEEGFSLITLEQVVKSMANTVKQAGIKVVAGDTKVVERGNADKLYINTTGIGVIKKDIKLTIDQIRPGDKIIINGGIGEHAVSILTQRSELGFHSSLKSDCCFLNDLVSKILEKCKGVRFLRDPTRGGLATVLKEIADQRGLSIQLDSQAIPVKEEVKYICAITGLDSLYLANEGKLIIIVADQESQQVLKILREKDKGRKAAIIGEVLNDKESKLYVKSETGGTRILNGLEGEILPRIC